ncbi:Chaperone SurA [subsurface metagenome]
MVPIRMRKIIFKILFLLAATNLIFADLIDKPAATVKLGKLEVIMVKQFRQKIDVIEDRTRSTLTLEDRKKFLDLLIGEILINQAAAKDNISVTNSELNARIKLARQTGGLSLNLNRELTELEFKSLIQQSGLSWDEYIEQMKNVIIQQKYVMQKKQPFFESLSELTDAEIEDFYQSNKTAFVAPDIVRFKHIYIDTRNLSEKQEKDKAHQRAGEIYRELQSGTAFEDLVVKYSDDKSSRYKGGDFGYLRRDDQARKQLLGKDFFETPFKMKVGEISDVLQSNIGFHIIKVVEKSPFKLLELNDKIPPQNKKSVKEEIKAQLIQRKQAEYYQQALLELLEELKRKAEIKIFEQNLSW